MANYFNPNGISLIREEAEIVWASDTLFSGIKRDTLNKELKGNSVINSDTQKNINPPPPENKEETITKSLSKNKQSQTTVKNQEKAESDVIAFSEPKAITLEQAYALFSNGVTFIDARDEPDYQASHILNAINIPYYDFENHKEKLNRLPKEEPLVIYCAGTDCDLSVLLGNQLFESGYKQVYVFFGGWIEWQEANYPIDSRTE